MSLQVSDVLSWDLATVRARVDGLRADSELFLESSGTVSTARKENLDGFASDTVTAATKGCRALARDIAIVGRKARSAVEALTAFCDRAPHLWQEVVTAFDEAGAALCRVADDGTVRGPLLLGDPSDPAVARAHEENDALAAGFERRILAALRSLEDLDLTAANALNLMTMTESYVHYPTEPELIEIDPRTIAAGATIDLNLNSLSSVAEAMDAARAVTRGLPVLGTILGLTIGLATRPEDESLGEALAVETTGIASTALAGATIGSLIPGLGTASGLVIGALLGATVGPSTTAGLRNHIERERADGKEGFRW